MDDMPTDPGATLTRFRRYTWWSLAGTTAGILVFAVGAWATGPFVPLPARVVGSLALTVTVVASAVMFSRRLTPAGPSVAHAGRLPLTWAVAGSVAAAVLGTILLLLRNHGLWSFAPATMASAVATFLPARQRWMLITAVAAGAAVLGGAVAAAANDDLLFAAAFPVGIVASIAWVTVGMLWSWDVAERLDEARRLSAELAVADERLRFAADLHDIQGHHLQVIARRSELASRLVERDPARAATEMREVQQLSTAALRDTRALVQGYRRTTLDAEIANATKVMTAADIDTRARIEPAAADGLPPTSRHLLGLVVREATTNVLRHSRARHAEVDFLVTAGRAHLRVVNDGVSGVPGAAGSAAGSGLANLAERMAAAGGELAWMRHAERFEVTASLPATSETA